MLPSDLIGWLQVKAVVMNHGSFTNREEIEALKQPILINASDNDQLLSRERLAQYTGVLDCKKDVPSDIKVHLRTELLMSKTHTSLLP